MTPAARLTAAALLLLCCAGTRAWAEDLTLKRVMLSSAGVGYFEYTADIDGDADLGLDVPLGQVDDILMSLVVFDPSGGVAGAELPGRDNTVQAFGDTPFGPEALRSPAAYLTALRGTEVTVQGPRPMTGRIVSAEPVTETIDTGTTQRVRVTLLGADGLRQFVLEDVDSVQITDPGLRDRVAQALESLRQDASLTARHMTIHVKGSGPRTVAVGYVAGAPLWKATYRLMLPAAATGSPSGAVARLQGWATLENQSGGDWHGVTLTLQYGDPVAFRQALYRSYFVQRPEVPLDIMGRTPPPPDSGAHPVTAGVVLNRAVEPPSVMAPAPMAPPAQLARAGENAEETTFTLTQPVDLAAGHTANVPILDREIPAARIGLVPWRARHPLSSLRVRNGDEHGLPAGVLTLYDATDAASFAGDARLSGLPAGAARLVSFAEDLRTSIETTESDDAAALTLLRVANGTLFFSSRTRAVIGITATAPANEARDLLLEIPRPSADTTLSLASGKATIAEQTGDAFRIALSLAPGETRTLTLWRDQPAAQALALTGGTGQVEAVIQDIANLKPAERAALDHIVELRRDEAAKLAQVAQSRKHLDDTLSDEDRVRKNLASVTTADALRARLTKALETDETKIEQLRKSIDDARADADKAHQALADAVAALRI